MRLKINPYLLSLIKENLIYIVANLVLVVVTIAVLTYNLRQLPEKDTQIATLENDVKDLTAKANLLNTPFLTEKADLDATIKVLDTLVPSLEDYFSIIYSLNELSKKTNFIINSYSINLQESSANKLQLIISGIGDQDAFMRFLKDYNFSGGRLMTCDRLELSSRYSGSIRLNVAFYNKSVTGGGANTLALTTKDWQELNKIKSKVSFLLKEASPESLIYPKKTNPF